MKNARGIGLSVLLVAGVFGFGCGGDDASEDADAAVADCTTVGLACTTGDECCTGYCDDGFEVCAREPGQCLATGSPCNSGTECCSFACVNAECSDTCVADNESCDNDGACCSGICDGTCTPLNPECATSGNPCGGDDECCSHYCVDDVCSPSPSFCTQTGDACVSDFECCEGLCSKDEGATVGTCTLVPASGASSCLAAGSVCGGIYDGEDLVCGSNCCSKACFPYPETGVLVCQPPSGCHPTGEICQTDSDCCGGPGNPDNESANIVCSKVDGNPIGRCDNGNACTPAGGICRLQEMSCSSNANCCAGNVLQYNTCAQDNLGIPRCLTDEQPPDTPCDPADYEGEPCATSADCCGLPCTPIGSGEFPQLVCNGTCVEEGGTCTTSADCCAGLPCTVPAGSTIGTCGADTGCSSYGQSCLETADCCNELPCLDGVCGVIVN